MLFLHGLGMGKEVWDPIVGQLQGHFQCITVDMLGCSGNLAPEGLRRIPFEAWIDEIQGIVKQLEVNSIHLVGHSLGSFIALAYAAAFPSECGSVTAISTLPEFDRGMTKAFEERARKVEALGMDGIINDIIAGGFSVATLRSKTDIIARYRKIVLQNTALQYALACRSISHLSNKPLLNKISAPVQLIVGLDDKVTPLRLSESANKYIPQARDRGFSRRGH